MHTFVLEKMSSVYDKMDSVIITNRDGVIEYAAVFDQSDHSIKNEGYTGKNILEVYPELTEEISSHYRAIRTGRPVIDEIQTLTDINGKTLTFSSSTYPIEMDGQIIGAIEGTVYLKEDGRPCRGEAELKTSVQTQTERLYTLDDIVSRDPKMLELKEKVERVAGGESFVLILGNTGTGKELVAQSLHSHSPRAKGPFISQNCAAIPLGLLESTLFGTTKGSYTGAEEKKGLFELADNGTIFLDEINSMDISLQGKILKVIEEQKIRRIGDERERKINVRVISAMNVSPNEAIRGGKLREDLFYRLGVVQIHLPDLMEREADIPELVSYFIAHFNDITGKKIRGCSDIAMKLLLAYPWPGNVRELRNAIEYAFNMVRGDEITAADLPDQIVYAHDDMGSFPRSQSGDGALHHGIRALREGKPLTSVVDDFEKVLIQEMVKHYDTTTEAAQAMHISRQALNYKLSKYGITVNGGK